MKKKRIIRQLKNWISRKKKKKYTTSRNTKKPTEQRRAARGTQKIMSWEIKEAIEGDNIVGNIDHTVTTENKFLKKGVKYVDDFCQSMRGLCESSRMLTTFFNDFHSALEYESLDTMTKSASKYSKQQNNWFFHLLFVKFIHL